jgi:hypothetical protein
MRDAYGRRRSSRSIPTGHGSRGGPSLSPAYWRKWRAAHAEYRERERTRCIRRRLVLRIRAIVETGTDRGYSRLTPRAGLMQAGG